MLSLAPLKEEEDNKVLIKGMKRRKRIYVATWLIEVKVVFNYASAFLRTFDL